MKRVVIDIKSSKKISGLVKVSVTSPAGLMKFFLNVEPCDSTSNDILKDLFIFAECSKFQIVLLPGHVTLL